MEERGGEERGGEERGGEGRGGEKRRGEMYNMILILFIPVFLYSIKPYFLS